MTHKMINEIEIRTIFDDVLYELHRVFEKREAKWIYDHQSGKHCKTYAEYKENRNKWGFQ